MRSKSRVELVYLAVYRCKLCGLMWGDEASALKCKHGEASTLALDTDKKGGKLVP
jgi:hypothetical protein